MGLLRQTWTLSKKNMRIAFWRHAFTTTIRAFFLPVIFMLFLSYSRNLFIPVSYYGVATPTPVRSLTDAMGAAGAGRNTLVFVNNGFLGGDIERVIDQVAAPLKSAGKTVKIVQQQADLLTHCKGSLRAVSKCFGAAVFYSSPNEGPDGMWNYTLRADGALGNTIDIRNANNDVEIYTIPLQSAIDLAIASQNSTIDQSALPKTVLQYPFTDENEQQRKDQIRTRFMSGITQILAVAFFIAVVGVIYQLVGAMASERELGMAQLLEAMMPNRQRWQPQFARLASYHIAFSLIYLPGWIVMSLILARGVFAKTNVAIIVIHHLLTGLSLASFAIFGASFFKKAQLSGIATTIIALLLGVLAQVLYQASTGAVAILSLLFPPMNYTYFIIYIARWERQNIGANMIKGAPQNPWTLPGIVFWVFLVLQIFIYPMLGAWVERSLYGTASKTRNLSSQGQESPEAVKISNFSKQYKPGYFSRKIGLFFGRHDPTVVAVNDLTLSALRGQILVLLGANGSGKSTTLDAICGLSKLTSGSIDVDGTGGLGLCPQRNVLWEDLTVAEHVRIFNHLKTTGARDSKEQILELVAACDLSVKSMARAKTLSGGQKRKLQLAMMFTGGSRVCAIDEVSSGLDPLSRRKIWDILLRERGARTLIFTTHFLDEADLLADNIAILSKGTLRAEGSSVELKHKLGGGYHVHVPKALNAAEPPNINGARLHSTASETIYSVPDSSNAAQLIEELDRQNISDYQVLGPTIEDVFLKVAEEAKMGVSEASGEASDLPENKNGSAVITSITSGSEGVKERDEGVQLRPGRRIGMVHQAWVLFRKRFTILQRNYLPHAMAFLIPIIAAGLVTLFLKGYKAAGCSPAGQASTFDIKSLETEVKLDLLAGPASRISPEALNLFVQSLPKAGSGGLVTNASGLSQSTHLVDNLGQFNSYISERFANVTPGGLFLGAATDTPTFAYLGNYGVFYSTITQNAFDVLLTNISISTQFQSFDIAWAPNTGKTLQLVVYFGLAMAAYPAFFALYPCLERLRNVRALHYSNGVRSLPLWLAYVAFDSVFVLVLSAIVLIIFAAASGAWYHVGYLFPVFWLYGLASILLAYVISLFAASQLAAFAFCAGGQAVMFLLYFIGYLSILTYSPTDKIDTYLNIFHFTFASITPTGNLIRAMFVALNVFSVSCHGNQISSNPGAMILYGGPITYFIVQSLVLLGILLWYDSGPLTGKLRRSYKEKDVEEREVQDKDVADELVRVNSSNDGLRVVHLTKAFKSNVAVQDLTFGVKPGEVFALLGPNVSDHDKTHFLRQSLNLALGCWQVDNYLTHSRRHPTITQRRGNICREHPDQQTASCGSSTLRCMPSIRCDGSNDSTGTSSFLRSGPRCR